MNTFRVVIISSIVLFCSYLDAASRQRRASYPMTRYQASDHSRSRKFLRHQWLKKKHVGSDTDDKGYVGYKGDVIFSRKEFMSALAQRRLDLQLAIRLGRSH